MGRTNIVNEESDRTDIYKQQSSDTTFNSFLGKSVERSQSFSSNNGLLKSYENGNSSRKTSAAGADHLMVDSRGFAQNGMNSRKSSAMSCKKSSSDNDSNYYSKSSSYSSSYQKTNINGEENQSSSYNEQHYDSRDGESSVSKHYDSRNGGNNGNGIDYSRGTDSVSSSRKNSMATEIERRNERQRRESSRKLTG